MNKAIDVALYVINTYNRRSNFPDINGYNLQPILFLIQAHFLKYENRPCFEDEIIKNSFHNVIIIYEVNEQFPFMLYSNYIYFQDGYYVNKEGKLYNHRRDKLMDIRTVDFKWNTISIYDRLVINDLLEKIKDFDSKELYNMVMEIPIVKDARLVITKEEIYNYVKGKEMKFWE